MARVGRNRDKRESSDSGLGSSPSDRYLTHDKNSAQLSTADISDDSFLLSCLSKNERDAVLYKLDSSTFNKLRRTEKELYHVLTLGRWRYSVRQSLYQLELTAEKIIYLTGRKTRKIFPFKLNEKNKYELLRVEPEYITVYGHIFGSETHRLMKKPSPKAATEKWKELCRFVMSQFGINLDSNGNVIDDSEIPKYATRLNFGATKLPVSLVQKHLENWSQEKCCPRLSTLEVSFSERLQDKEATAEELLSGLKFEKIWAPSSHEESIFGDAVLWEYEEKLLKEYSMSVETDPVLIYAALSKDRKRMAVLGIADHAIKLSFCRVEKDRAYFILRDIFMQITESKDYNSVSEWALNRMLERLRA